MLLNRGCPFAQTLMLTNTPCCASDTTNPNLPEGSKAQLVGCWPISKI